MPKSKKPFNKPLSIEDKTPFFSSEIKKQNNFAFGCCNFYIY